MNQSRCLRRCVGSLALDDFMIFLAVVIEKTVFQSHKIQVGE